MVIRGPETAPLLWLALSLRPPPPLRRLALPPATPPMSLEPGRLRLAGRLGDVRGEDPGEAGGRNAAPADSDRPCDASSAGPGSRAPSARSSPPSHWESPNEAAAPVCGGPLAVTNESASGSSSSSLADSMSREAHGSSPTESSFSLSSFFFQIFNAQSITYYKTDRMR